MKLWLFPLPMHLCLLTAVPGEALVQSMEAALTPTVTTSHPTTSACWSCLPERRNPGAAQQLLHAWAMAAWNRSRESMTWLAWASRAHCFAGIAAQHTAEHL